MRQNKKHIRQWMSDTEKSVIRAALYGGWRIISVSASLAETSKYYIFEKGCNNCIKLRRKNRPPIRKCMMCPELKTEHQFICVRISDHPGRRAYVDLSITKGDDLNDISKILTILKEK